MIEVFLQQWFVTFWEGTENPYMCTDKQGILSFHLEVLLLPYCFHWFITACREIPLSVNWLLLPVFYLQIIPTQLATLLSRTPEATTTNPPASSDERYASHDELQLDSSLSCPCGLFLQRSLKPIFITASYVLPAAPIVLSPLLRSICMNRPCFTTEKVQLPFTVGLTDCLWQEAQFCSINCGSEEGQKILRVHGREWWSICHVRFVNAEQVFRERWVESMFSHELRLWSWAAGLPLLSLLNLSHAKGYVCWM